MQLRMLSSVSCVAGVEFTKELLLNSVKRFSTCAGPANQATGLKMQQMRGLILIQKKLRGRD